jgi:tRNA pseudouridine38-40 synthase
LIDHNENIEIVDIIKVDESFHSRHYAIKRTYTYRIIQTDKKNKEELKYYTWMLDPSIKLDIENMKKSCECLLGINDFTSFKNTINSVLYNF